ncbi:MAG: carboxypeptidase-like regulatory domain-containing protein [Ignavibacteriae bacterium]|nr:carboxypeptidase-like regulatory domain-containing protein [Ignavibacteriota bacterium]
MKKIFLLFLCFPFILFGGVTGKISGVIKDSQTGEPLIGANILIEGTNLGAATDVNGNYVILNIPPKNIMLK